ncbi:MAG: tetratricopeptide repeat protein [Betaproteobacteria bacterium]|nr:tetratricopeptide repeat protein [Betaproteobacteria bacterium]
MIAAPASRNALCPCGSGKRYKHCHGVSANAEPLATAGPAPEPVDIASLLHEGLARSEVGDHLGAARIYREVLERDPRHPDAWHLLGLLDLAADQPAAALQKFEQAIAAYADHPGFHLSRARAELALEQMTAALAHAREMVRNWPELAAGWTLLGTCLGASSPEEATAALRTALRLDPQDAAAAFELARLLHDAQHHETAAEVLRDGLRHHPNDALLLNNLGLNLEKLGQEGEAMEVFRAALLAKPGFAPARANLGRRLLVAGKAGEALAYLEPPAQELRDSLEYWITLALARQSVGRVEDALPAFREAHRLKPFDARVNFNLGSAYFEIPLVEEAQRYIEEALRLQPEFAAAEIVLLEIARRRCDWPLYRRLIERLPAWINACEELMPPPHAMVSLPTSAADQKRVAIAYTRCLGVAAAHPHLPSPASPSGRLRLGYLTTAIREHPTTALVTEVLERHDRQRFEVSVYSCGPKDASAYRTRIFAAVERFVDLQMASDAEIADRIRGDGIDILIDLDGYTQHARSGVPPRRPAPMQVNYLGFPGTLGSSWHDFVVTDRVVTPPEAAEHFTERFLYLPHCYLPSDTRRKAGVLASTRADWNLPESGLVFCSFNHLYKLLPEMFEVWMHILRETPGSVLWVLAHEAVAQGALRGRAAALGVAPERLKFAGPAPMEKHLARYPLADLFLDNLPCNAHTTCNDALLMGLPVLTCRGETFAGRVAASHLTAAGLPELITNTLGDYAALAIKLAREPALLRSYRQRLAALGTRSPLFDMAAYTRALEDGLERAWEELQADRARSAATAD